MFSIPLMLHASDWSGFSGSYLPVTAIPGVKVDLKYAGTDNFMAEDLYGSAATALLHPHSHAKLAKAATTLKKSHPKLHLLVYDALRPRRVQRRMWAKVKDTPERKYVADPDKGSMHNYGMALDLTLCDGKDRALDMGTPYDAFTELAQPKFEEKFLKEGKLTKAQLENRLILRKTMEAAGFKQLAHEWWHYDALPDKEVRKMFEIVE